MSVFGAMTTGGGSCMGQPDVCMTPGTAGPSPGGTMSVQFKGGSGKVKAEGKAVAHHTATTAHNGNNANAPMGKNLSPSQQKVKVSP